MPMPTTRYGRYLFYRARARKRRNRAWGRGPAGGNTVNRKTGRAFDLSDYTKQVPPTPPLLRVAPPRGDDFWEHVATVKPERGVWGVVPLVPFWPPWRVPTHHFRFPVVGFHNRRLLSLPRLKHVPRKPWHGPTVLLLPWEFFPLTKYPSGRPNPNGWIVPPW